MAGDRRWLEDNHDGRGSNLPFVLSPHKYHVLLFLSKQTVIVLHRNLSSAFSTRLLPLASLKSSSRALNAFIFIRLGQHAAFYSPKALVLFRVLYRPRRYSCIFGRSRGDLCCEEDVE